MVLTIEFSSNSYNFLSVHQNSIGLQTEQEALGQFSNLLTSKIQIHVWAPKLELLNQMWFYSSQIIGVHLVGERFIKQWNGQFAFCALCSVKSF